MTELPLSSDTLLKTVYAAVKDGESLIIAGSGDSMLPFIRPDLDKILLTPLPDRKLLPGDIVLYWRGNGQAVIHRIYRVHGETFDMLGDNQIWVEENVPCSHMIAYVKQVLRPDGHYDCDTNAERRRAVQKMKNRLHPKKDTMLRRYVRAGKRRLVQLIKKVSL